MLHNERAVKKQHKIQVILKNVKKKWKQWFGPDVSKREKKENMEILGLSSSNEKAAAGSTSWFDPGVETASRHLVYIFVDVSGAIWAPVGRVETTSEEAEN